MATPDTFRYNINPSTQQAVDPRSRTPERGPAGFGSASPEQAPREGDPRTRTPERGPAGFGDASPVQRGSGSPAGGGGDTPTYQLDPERDEFIPGARLNPEIAEFMDEARSRINSATDMFEAIQSLSDSGLSPEAQAQVDRLREQVGLEVGRINDQINNRMAQMQVGQEVADRSRGQFEGALDQAAGLISGAGQDVQGALGELRTGGASNVRKAYEDAANEAANALGDAVPTADGSLKVSGGAVNPSERAKQEQEIDESVRELEDIVATNIEDTGKLNQEIAGAVSKAASAQLSLLDITDQKARNRMTTEFETAIRNDVHNMVQQRQDIRREEANAITALQEEDRRRQDQFGLGFSGDDLQRGMYESSVLDTVSSSLDNLGVEYKNPNQPELVAQAALSWASMTTEQKDQGLVTIGDQVIPTEELARELGISKEDLEFSLEAGSVVGQDVFMELNDEDRKVYEPGSHSLAKLVYESALESGFPEQVAVEWANSPSLHELIKIQSEGKTNANKGGNMHGIGGMPDGVYEALNTSWEEVKDDPQAQMSVFLAYMASKYGDPAAALTAFTEDKSLDMHIDDEYKTFHDSEEDEQDLSPFMAPGRSGN